MDRELEYLEFEINTIAITINECINELEWIENNNVLTESVSRYSGNQIISNIQKLFEKLIEKTREFIDKVSTNVRKKYYLQRKEKKIKSESEYKSLDLSNIRLNTYSNIDKKTNINLNTFTQRIEKLSDIVMDIYTKNPGIIKAGLTYKFKGKAKLTKIFNNFDVRKDFTKAILGINVTERDVVNMTDVKYLYEINILGIPQHMNANNLNISQLYKNIDDSFKVVDDIKKNLKTISNLRSRTNSKIAEIPVQQLIIPINTNISMYYSEYIHILKMMTVMVNKKLIETIKVFNQLNTHFKEVK